MVKSLKSLYAGYTLMELLVVMSIMVVIGGVGTFSIMGLREAVVLDQSRSNLKLDLQRAQQASMLIERGPDENWIHGIGIDFSTLPTDGTYRFFKWVSNSPEFDSVTMSSELLAYDDSGGLGEIGLDGNAILPLGIGNMTGTIVPLPGFEETSFKAGIDITLEGLTVDDSQIAYIVFESVTGRAFLYDENGIPANYSNDLSGELEYTSEYRLVINISRNKGTKKDILTIYPSTGFLKYENLDNE